VPSWFDYKVDNKKHNWLDFDGITIITENIEVNDQHLVFDVEIKNETDYRLRFNPGEVYYLGSDSPYPTDSRTSARIAFESNLQKRYALTENQVANHLEYKIKKQKRTALATGILSAGLVVFNAAMNVKGMNKEWSPKVQRQENIRNLLSFGGLVAMDVVRDQTAFSAMDAREDLYFLSDEIIEEGVIYPRQAFRGKMFFPTCYDKNIRLIIPVESKEFVLDFRWAGRKEERKLMKTQ
jgi:hypothetical protein